MGVGEGGAGPGTLVDDQLQVVGVAMGAHPLAPGRDRGGELLGVELGHRGHVLGCVDDHLMAPARRPRRKQVSFARPARGEQRVAALAEGAGFGRGPPAPPSSSPSASAG